MQLGWSWPDVEVVGSLESSMIVFHALLMLCVNSFDVMTSSLASFCTTSIFPISVAVSPNVLFDYCFLYALQIDQGHTVLGIHLVYAFWMSHTLTL